MMMMKMMLMLMVVEVEVEEGKGRLFLSGFVVAVSFIQRMKCPPYSFDKKNLYLYKYLYFNTSNWQDGKE